MSEKQQSIQFQCWFRSWFRSSSFWQNFSPWQRSVLSECSCFGIWFYKLHWCTFSLSSCPVLLFVISLLLISFFFVSSVLQLPCSTATNSSHQWFSVFKCRLKTFLFNQAFTEHWSDLQASASEVTTAWLYRNLNIIIFQPWKTHLYTLVILVPFVLVVEIVKNCCCQVFLSSVWLSLHECWALSAACQRTATCTTHVGRLCHVSCFHTVTDFSY